ncbi:hypothetical protein ACFQY0_03505 [Haloferula chungangensis]|uniref:Transporter n=1 Tax=Haloferula chungangensis TaxID=1048331 RepID=A0ABW2L522_9BACT
MKTPHTLLLGALFTLPCMTWAEETPGQLFEHVPQRAWLENYDPTLIGSRTFSEFIFESFDDDIDTFKIENTIRWGIPVGDDLAAGFQVMIPVKWYDSPASDNFGLGNIESRAGLVGRFSQNLRWGAGVNAEFDSASDDNLGGGAFILRPTAVLSWDVSKRVNLGMNIEYNFTPFSEGPDDVSTLELKFPVAFKINECWSGFVSYKPSWLFLDEDERHLLESGVTRVFGAREQYALSIVGEIPLVSEDYHFKLAAGFGWYF